MKQRVKEMEEEAAKLREMQAQVEKDMNMSLDTRKEARDMPLDAAYVSI